LYSWCAKMTLKVVSPTFPHPMRCYSLTRVLLVIIIWFNLFLTHNTHTAPRVVHSKKLICSWANMASSSTANHHDSLFDHQRPRIRCLHFVWGFRHLLQYLSFILTNIFVDVYRFTAGRWGRCYAIEICSWSFCDFIINQRSSFSIK
jgi:hypothetical protein